ncbi:MAG TPA: acyl-CoA thioesterase II [Myxococcota bacterium]
MSEELTRLLSLLDLEPLEVDYFRGHSPQKSWQRVFGGQVLGQALVAARRSVEDRSAHSFHAYFLRPGDRRVPILYQVDRTRDGRSFTTRRVIAVQHGEAIFHMEASFHREEAGLEHQCAMPDVPEPESLPSWHERMQPLESKLSDEAREWLRREPFDVRLVTPVDLVDPGPLPPRLDLWLRVRGELPPDLWLHQCLAAYASDLSLIDTMCLPHAIGVLDTGYQFASLDHAMWFHRPFRADQWLLYSQESPAAARARGFACGRLFTREGQLVVSVVQEGLIRPAKPR